MTPERWRRIEALFHEACARPPADRAAFLLVACADDEAMRRDVESLLDDSASDDGFLAAPAFAMSAHQVSGFVPRTMTGTTLGGYHFEALLGAGGMGEVYRAHDPKLGRDVAIKVLPSAFTSHPERLARLEREARILAALNHPNICAIYGFEEAVGIRLLILELVEGESLSEILADDSSSHARGEGLPLDRVLNIARQIAEALEIAHDKGIVHRDLKPANVKITPAGAVKVLDFGLAKAVAGDGPGPDLSNVPLDDGPRRKGAVIGTAAYMSPEQARGFPVDRRTDIWAFGCVLYEMLTGRVTFGSDTVSDSIARILEREPDWSALPATTPTSIRRLLLRCLAKDPKKRLRDMGDVRIELDATDEMLPVAAAPPPPLARANRVATWLPWIALAVIAVTVGTREALRSPTERNPPSVTAVEENALASATFSRVTNWPGTEEHAEISPDGRFVAFVADRLGQFDIWVSQLGTGTFANLTLDIPPMLTPGNVLRSLGFNGDGSEIWFNPSGNPGQHKVLVPLTGGATRPFLAAGNSTPSWSPRNSQVAYIAANAPGDPLFIADRTGGNPIEIDVNGPGKEGVHTHNPVWSADGQWIYFVHGTGPTGRMDVWRVQPSGKSLEQLTYQHADVNFLAPIDLRTLLYVARAEDWSGPWLWALDVESKITRRVTVGLEQYTSLSASRDGRRVVATVAKPTASLWQMPLRDGRIEDREAQPYRVKTERALAPRFAGTSLFYLSLSTRGTGDGLWRVQNGEAFEVTKGADSVFSEPPAVSPDGRRVAVGVRHQGQRHLALMSSDGTNSRTLAASIDIQGVVGQGAADWSPDGSRIVMSGRDYEGPGLFVIAVDGGEAVRLVSTAAYNPIWSPKGDLIVYAAGFGGAGGLNVLRGVRPDGTAVQLPDVPVRLGGAHRFLPSGRALVYLPNIESKDFWLLDLDTRKTRQLTYFSDRGFLNTFDITPDGQHLVFDRSQQNSDVVLIDLPKK